MRGVKRERDDDYEERESNGTDEDAQGEEDASLAEDDVGAGPSGRSKMPVSFAKGAVKLVKVHDFMTYNGTVVIRPGPRLNLVLGPNGTGKSSLVCALCLGLNGSPKTLGRADNIKDFVRRGAHSFWSEITLSSGGEGRDHVVRRTVTVRVERDPSGERRERHESKWKLNGVDATSKDVDKLIKRLNIQFDNLCQFLPQDKVAEFAKMNQYELFEATLMAVGDASLHQQHQQLIQLRKDEKQERADHTTSSQRLEKLQAEQERQRRDYERFQQREQLLEQARVLQSHAKWLEVLNKGKAAKAAKLRLLEKREKLKELEDQHEERIRPIREREAVLKEIRQGKLVAEHEAREADVRMRRIGRSIQEQDMELGSRTEELSSLEQQSKERVAHILQARQRLEKAQADLAQAPARVPPELINRVQELKQLIQASNRESSEVEAQQNNLTLQIQNLQGHIGRVRGQLDMLNSRKHQMLQRLGQVYRNVGLIHAFIEQQRTNETFRGLVLGPLALELSVRPPPGMPYSRALQYVESCCSKHLASYVVTDPSDEALLNEEARKLNVAASVKFLCTQWNANQSYQTRYPAGHASQHGRYGIVHTVDELIETAPIFSYFVAELCKANMAYIGTAQTAECMDSLARETPIQTVLVDGIRLSVIRSRYNSDMRNVEQVELYPPRMLGAGGGSEEAAVREHLLQKEREVAQERDALQAEVEQLGQQLQQQEHQRKNWEAEIRSLDAHYQAIQKKRTDLMAAVGTAERNLRAKEAVPDPELRRPELRRIVGEKVTQMVRLAQDVMAALQELWEAVRRSEVQELRLAESTAQLHALRASREVCEQEVQTARNHVAKADEAFKSATMDFKRARDFASENHVLSDSEKEDLRRLQAEDARPDVLRAMAEAKVAEAEEVVCHNQNVVDEFQKRQAEIAQLEAAVKQQDERCQGLRSQIDHVQGVWLPEIILMVNTINSSFANNFKDIGCAGEVRLHQDEDFEKFAVQILVQFRAHEDMQLLSGTRQSGGERSVSTILYLIALQGVTETPFRVVDEINQGMDPINERKVYKQLVAASTEDSTPQCFLLTPKLLSGLEYTHDIHTLIICSSAEMEEGLPVKFSTNDIWE